MREIEAHFLEVDPEAVGQKLSALGAKKVQDEIIIDRIYEHLSDSDWHKHKKRVRLRQDGKKSQITFKELKDFNVLGGTEELETEISDLKAMEQILLYLGLSLKRRAEKRRVRYILNTIKFDLEFWPKLKPLLEIESDSEDKVREGAKLLGLNWENANFMDMKDIYEKIYNIPIENIKILTFDKFE
jgi:adenylate cyclase class 2